MALAIAVPAAAGCDDDDRPAAPHSLRANPLGSGGIMLQWSSNAGHYDIAIRDKNGQPVPEAPDITGGATNENYHEFYGLKPDKEYFFTIRARTEGGTEGCISGTSDTVSARTDPADMNSFCSRYAKEAIKQVNDLRGKGCEHPGNLYTGPWAVDERTHFLFCLEQKRNRKTGYEDAQKERDKILPQCTLQADACKKYRDTAVKAAKENKDLKCGKTGGRWSEDEAAHYSWCMSVPRSSKEPASETEKREKALAECRSKKANEGGGEGGACPVPDEWAAMLKAHNDERAKYCGAPLTWSCKLAEDAQSYATKCILNEHGSNAENMADLWKDDDSYPAGKDEEAYEAVWGCERDEFHFDTLELVFGFKDECHKGKDGGKPVNGHFTQVVWRANTAVGCGRAKCTMTDKDGKTHQGTHWVCRYSPGGNNPGAVAQNVQQPPACTTQKFHSRSISCSRGMVPTDDGRCACPPGRRWNGRTCARRGITSTPPAQPQPGTGGTCPRDRPVGTPPNCCPAGTTFDGAVCRAPTRTTPSPVCTGDRPVGTYPNCCPRGTFFSDGKCRTGGGGTIGTQPGGGTGGRPRCTGDRPVGTYPNCCPTGTFFSDGKCRTGGGGTIGTQPGGGTVGQPRCAGDRPVGTYPNCCPTGTFFSDGKCRTGGGGTIGTQPGGGTVGQPRCAGDRPVGTYPNCCPRGTSFQNGKCVRPTTTTNPSGNGGTSGSKPCPSGTHATRSGQCEPDASPTTPTSKGRCTGGRVGTPPRCFCPGGRRFIGGRCRSVPKTTPAPTGPTPKKVCPSGLTGPNCDQVIVH